MYKNATVLIDQVTCLLKSIEVKFIAKSCYLSYIMMFSDIFFCLLKMNSTNKRKTLVTRIEIYYSEYVDIII